MIPVVLSLLAPIFMAFQQPTLAGPVEGQPDAHMDYELNVSAMEGRGNFRRVEDAIVLSGRVFIFVSPPEGINRVRFFLDVSDESLANGEISEAPTQIDDRAPFDFAGSQGDPKKAKPYDTIKLSDGWHSITAELELRDGTTELLHTSFIVHNGRDALLFGEEEVDVHLPSNARKSVAVPLVTSSGKGATVRVTENASWLSIEDPPLDPDDSSRRAPDEVVLEFDTSGLQPGTYTATLSASAASTSEGATQPASDTMTVTTTVDATATTCSPIPCSEIKIGLPYQLSFDQDHGKILDGNGVGTGFTYIDQPSNGTGYIPGNLAVDFASPGTLDITTTSGLASQGVNSLDNALGVGIDAPSQVSVLSATISNPPAGSLDFEQAGLWFGNDEDNYVKLIIMSSPNRGGTVIQHFLEVGGQQVKSKTSGVVNLTGQDITLRLAADPTDRSISASYTIGGGSPTPLGEFIAPGEFFSFDAAGIDPEIGTRSFGGVFASHRNASAPLVYSFDSFSVTEGDVLPPSGEVSFQKKSYPLFFPTSMVWGPDNRLYVTELFGKIHALTFDSAKNVTNDQVITTLGSRLTLGITVDPQSTPSNVILWVSHSNDSTDNGQLNSSMVSRLSGPNFTTRQDVITGLPRAIANHAVNSIHFGPDGKLYIAQAGNTGAGAPNTANTEFGTRAEQPLSAAILVADVNAAGFDGTCATPEETLGPAPCDVQVYSSGLRNTYDFVWHSNGALYGPDNGLGVIGTYPPSPTPPCGGLADPAVNNPGEQPDILNRLEPNKYYGHPNPYRNGNGWSPQCVFKDGTKQGVAPLPNYTPPIYNLGRNRSANGTIEYTANTFNGALKGEILIVNYSIGDDITRVRLSSDGRSVIDAKQLVGGFNNPLSIAQGPDGTIYIGETGNGQVTALIPESVGTWTTKAPAPVALLDAGGTGLGGKFYVVDGKTNAGPQRTLYIYDPATDSWSNGPDLPTAYPAVENPAVVAYNGKLYAFGGSTTPFAGAVTSAAVFDPATSSWTMLASMAVARGGATAQAIGDKIYVVGGMGEDGASLASLEIYDPAANSWSSGAVMSTRRDNPGSAALGGKLYVFGGRTRNADGTTVNGTLNTVEMYDPATNSWVPRTSMPTGRRTMVVGTLDGKAQVMGGEAAPGGAAFAQNEEYDPATDSWKILPDMPTGRHGAAAATINGVVYVATGGPTAGTAFSNVNEAFAPVGSAPGDTTPPAAPANLSATLNGAGSAIVLNWDDNAEPDLAGYHVYRSPASGGPFTRLTTTPLTVSAYTDSTAPTGTSYYRVTALDTSSNESPPSNTANATKPGDTTPPAAPTGLAATGSPAGISLDWNNNSESDLAGYNVYRSSSPSGPFTKITATLVTDSAYNDTTAPVGVSHYRVTAVDTSTNESAPSSTVQGTRPAPDSTPPAAPTNLTANVSADGLSIQLDWNDNTETDLAGYNVYRSGSATGPFTKVNSALVTTSSYSDATAPIGTSYYQVKAIDTSNNESGSSNTANATRTSNTPTFDLVVSLSPNRSSPLPLNGQTVSGNIYVFTTPDTADILRVRFWLDNPTMSGAPRRSENSAPYDFAGGTVSTANPFNTATVTDGSHTITASIDLKNGTSTVVNATFTANNATPPPPPPPDEIALPGTIQAEDYRSGGAGVGYNDTTSGNAGGAYRSDDVDIQPTTDPATPNGFNVGWTVAGEWLAYNVTVASGGAYTFTIRVSTPNSGQSLRIEIDDVNVTGSMLIPVTGGWQSWVDVTSGPINLTAGSHVLKVFIETTGFNLNFVSVAPS